MPVFRDVSSESDVEVVASSCEEVLFGIMSWSSQILSESQQEEGSDVSKHHLRYVDVKLAFGEKGRLLV